MKLNLMLGREDLHRFSDGGDEGRRHIYSHILSYSYSILHICKELLLESLARKPGGIFG
jgi:hypothetical protein